NLLFEKVSENPKVSAIEIHSLSMPSGTNQRIQIIDKSKPSALPIDGESVIAKNNSISREEISISAYPNPFDSIIYFRMPGGEPQDYLIRVYDVSGKEYYRKVFRTDLKSSSIFEIDLSNLMLASGGVYLLVVESDKGEFIRTVKMIKR
ncbi:T9SS type A sorting domain-containing protein, partial [Cyclobacterium salsum]|uniref:T9SS type A sorting domain-containing protein n=1 Tax=Cyclobacterium salsum TaxID=2666329 RepID=UPI00139151D2